MNNKNKKYIVNLEIGDNEKDSKKTVEFNIVRKKSEEKPKTKKIVYKRNIFIRGFFGWENIKWFIREIGKLYSPTPSYFSKKRFESSIAFIIAQWGMILYLYNNYNELTMSDFLLWATAEFIISGYYINQIQSEKKDRGYEEYHYEMDDSDDSLVDESSDEVNGESSDENKEK